MEMVSEVKYNFVDPQTGGKFLISSYRICIDTQGTKYVDKSTGKQAVNPDTGTILDMIKTEGPVEVPHFGKFSGTSKEGVQNLKKHFGGRAKKFDSGGAGRDIKDEKVKAFKDQIIERRKNGLM